MTGRNLHIGGRQRCQGWEILNIQDFEGVDHVGDAASLSRFEAGTFERLYASHVLEHFPFAQVPAVLREWGRVLVPQGRLYLSVPDLSVLCELFQSDALSLQERFEVMKIIYGGQVDACDFHHVGFDRDLLGDVLPQSGFRKLRFVDHLGLFDDTSDLELHGRQISLNVIAGKA